MGKDYNKLMAPSSMAENFQEQTRKKEEKKSEGELDIISSTDTSALIDPELRSTTLCHCLRRSLLGGNSVMTGWGRPPPPKTNKQTNKLQTNRLTDEWTDQKVNRSLT